jgi:diguanylate cyclase (GGDEF)-like protein
MSAEKKPSSPYADPILAGSPLFATMSKLEFNALAAFLEWLPVKKDASIFREGDEGKEMFVLLSGALNAYAGQSDGTQRFMFEIKPGDFFGEMSIIADEPRSLTISAKEASELMILQGIDFYRIVYEHPIIGVKLLRAIMNVQNLWFDQNSRQKQDLARWGETARRRAITDDLTGLYNRRFLEDYIKNRFEQGSVGLRKMALMMMDLDKVHVINERHGTQAGDAVITAVAEIIRSQIRSEDIAARLSGDEFSIFLPDTDYGEARLAAERIREAVMKQIIQVPKSPGAAEKTGINIRISIGISVAPTHAKTVEGFVFSADGALKKAKDLGRNRVELAY